MALNLNIRWLEFQTALWIEIFVRVLLIFFFLQLEDTPPFIRKIHLDELWLYKNPRTDSYVPTSFLWPLVFGFPSSIIFLYYLWKRDKTELGQSYLAFSLALGLNGVLTDIIKLIVGRPRPDFFYRCFPEGHKGDLDDVLDIGSICDGEPTVIKEGRKSFPSGHSSFSFCSLGFLSLWLCGKLSVFAGRRGEGWKLIVGIAPIVGALMIALSRTSDYHHHWQDVLVGSLLGFTIAYLCYRQYYPSLTSRHCHLSYVMVPVIFSRPPFKQSRSECENERERSLSVSLDMDSSVDEQMKYI